MRPSFSYAFLLRPGAKAFLLYLVLLAAAPVPYVIAAGEDSRILLSFLHKIEEQRYSWYGFSSAVRMTFTTGEGKTAACSGTLDYQRMNERVFTACYASPEKLAFILKTDDERFSLYLPSHQTLYEGNIFDLEFAEEIESHIQPMDLYRSLKTMPILPESAVLESNEGETAVLWVKKIYGGEAYPERRLAVDNEGRVESETYMDREGMPYLEIERTGFKKIKAKSMSSVPVVLPSEITFRNLRRNTQTRIRFTDFRAASAENKNWKLPLPQGTRVVELPKFSGSN